MGRLKVYVPAAGIFALALLVRILYNLIVARNYIPTFDAALYNTLGRNLADMGCFCLYNHHPSISRPPLWPFILAAIYTLFGKQEFYGRIFYCLIGSGTCALIYLFSRDLFGKKIALLSGILAAIYPCLFIYDGWLYTESLYTFCSTACIYTLYRLQLHYISCSEPSPGNNSWVKHAWQSLLHHRWPLLCGLSIGLASLTRPNGVFLSGVVVFWAILFIIVNKQVWKTVLTDTLLIAFIAAITILPWLYRNYQVSHSFVLVSTGIGEVLAGAYNDSVFKGGLSISGTWQPAPGSLHHDAYNYTPKDDAAETGRALNWIHTHLSTLPYLLSLHFINMWIPYSYSHGLAFEQFPGSFEYYFMICMIYTLTTPVILAAFVGLFFTWKQYKHQLLVVYLFLALVVLQNVIFYSDMRFRAPIEPMLILLAGQTFYTFALFANRKNSA